ncbi:MAG: minor capsid protein [Clostridium perfringens]|nr:minor capsid protein [Clostridium perfringens]MDU0868472.1 minor capsid protein [Clostridium perfringens]MDU2507134.1 minor capsid protein [Clostridium perfringens]MDU3196596.1 minor capsid protein [Clostridium perfringens]MDU3868093.1 minor capsid protein [Clostridium perfringens]MDU6351587.1 minor capsid protein [Clostridium perfringens]
MYQEASLSISDELYRVAEKMKTATPTLSDMYKFNRLNNLQNNINSIIKELGSNVENFGKKNMYKGFSENYKATMEAIGEVSFDIPNKKLMKEILDRPWKGNNFSERLWKNTKVLAMNLNDILTAGLTQGKTITEMAIQLNNRMNEGFNVAHKLVKTETMHYLNESSFKAYQDAGCEEVQVWAAVDERTCPTCGIRHGNVYRIRDKPTLPFHANCRCVYLPVVYIEDAKIDHDQAKEDINNEFNRRHDLDNGLNNNNRKLNISKSALKHSNEGDFTNPKNPKKQPIGTFKGGGHGESNIKILDKYNVEYNIVEEYSNGVRLGNVPTHKEKKKKIGKNQSWFPPDWNENDIRKAGEYVANLKNKNKYILEEIKYNDVPVVLYKYANYNDVTVCICYNCSERTIKTVFPDGEQRLLKRK